MEVPGDREGVAGPAHNFVGGRDGCSRLTGQLCAELTGGGALRQQSIVRLPKQQGLGSLSSTEAEEGRDKAKAGSSVVWQLTGVLGYLPRRPGYG